MTKNTDGSSPLARGLPEYYSWDSGFVGIIPARAGFTSTTRSRRTARTDHPRSRGVYSLWSTSRATGVGSSPLARGLPVLHEPDGTLRRIIPARAGFTRQDMRRPHPAADHPRSRGVYRVRHSNVVALGGSSPLARGLRHVRHRPSDRLRIIPARAGFTPGTTPLVTMAGDHPRSRGVYVTERWELRPDEGSSPLARGLPEYR